MIHEFLMQNPRHTYLGYTPSINSSVVRLDDENPKDKIALPEFVKAANEPLNGIFYQSKALMEAEKARQEEIDKRVADEVAKKSKDIEKQIEDEVAKRTKKQPEVKSGARSTDDIKQS